MKKKYKPIQTFVAIDTETTGLFGHHGCRPFAVSTCDQDGNTNYWETPVNPATRTPNWTLSTVQKIWDYLIKFDVWVFHNLTFDLWMLSFLPSRKFGQIAQFMEEYIDFHDTLVRAHLFNSKEPLGLKEQALLHCGILDDDEKELDDCIKHLRHEAKKRSWTIAEEGIEELAGQRSKFHKCDFWIAKEIARSDRLPSKHPYHNICKTYAIKDSIRTAALFIRQEQTFESHPELLKPYKIQKNVILPIYRMAQQGISLHRIKFQTEMQEAENAKKVFVKTLRKLCNDSNFNPNSGLQLKKVIYEQFKFRVDRSTAKGNPSTDKSALPGLLNQDANKDARKFISTLLQYREVDSALKYMHSYQRFQRNEILYPSFNQCGTSTTRLSSSNPNGQNIGKGKERFDEDGNAIIAYSIRRVFGPDKGKVWSSIDYDQLQLRIFAYWSKESSLIDAFVKGFDFHTYMAMLIFETDEPTKIQRRVAKNVNFGYIFGAGENKIDATAGMPGIFRRVQSLFPNVTDAINRTVSFVRKHGYITTASGYRLNVPRNKAYAGVNYIVQGTEGDIVKTAITKCDIYLKSIPDIRIILQVHDELLFSANTYLGLNTIKKHLNTLAKLMEESGNEFEVPCICKPEIILDNWGEAIKLSDWRSDYCGDSSQQTRRRTRNGLR